MASREESTGPGSKSLDPGSSLNVFPAPFALCTVSPGPPSDLPVSFHRAGESGGLLRVELDTFDEFVLNHPEIQNVRANSQKLSEKLLSYESLYLNGA